MKTSSTKSDGKQFFKELHLSANERRWAEKNSIDLPPALIEDNRKRASTIGTLSFPVSGREHRALRDNSDIIAEIIRRRQLGLLLCAGWSVPSAANLAPIKVVTRRTKTVAVLEVSGPKRAYYRLEDGQSKKMGEQFFARSNDTKDPRCLTRLAKALPKRSFDALGRKVVLLICGEINLLQGRANVHVHPSAPDDLRDAVRAKSVLILNPTHTRMGNGGTIKAKRKFLSQEGRVYVSASNWDVLPKKKKRAQQPSATLHAVWHNGKCMKHDDIDGKQGAEEKCSRFVCREWLLPQ